MKAIIRIYPGSCDTWKYYDRIDNKSFDNIEDAKESLERNGLDKVIKIIEDEDYDKYENYLNKHRELDEI